MKTRPLFLINLNYPCYDPKCTYKADCCTKPKQDATPNELAKHMFCLAHGQNTGQKLLRIETTIGKLARVAGGMIPWLNTALTITKKKEEEEEKNDGPDHGFHCGHNECNKWATKNLPINPSSVTPEGFARRSRCDDHADIDAFDIDQTLDQIQNSLPKGQDFWNAWEERSKNAPKFHEFFCMKCGKKATHNQPVDCSTILIPRLKQITICEMHSDSDDQPIGLTIANAKRLAGGTWEAWEARQPQDVEDKPKETRRSRRHRPGNTSN